MPTIVELIKCKEGFCGMTGILTNEILDAEQKLGLHFSSEYREYLMELGLASFAGHELTGICKSPRLNVVDVTQRNRELHTDVSTDWYVLEESNFDDIVVWQSGKGEVYQTMPHMPTRMIAHSMAEYLAA